MSVLIIAEAGVNHNGSFELAKKTHFDLQMGNFLTYANVEYPDFKGGAEIFDIERSIYEASPKEINEEYIRKTVLN